MYGLARIDRIKKGDIRGNLRVAPTSENIEERRLKWYGHICRRQRNKPTKRIKKVGVQGTRKEGDQ